MAIQSGSKESKRVRYAVVGAGHIAQVAVLPAFRHAAGNSELVAVISGDESKRAKLSEQYALELADDYDALERVLEAGKIDAVYIATPNTLHAELAKRAAACHVHVLCEKPLAPSVAECEALATACEENGVKLMVAYRLHFEEATLRTLELVRSGKIGQARIFDSVFTHVVRPSDIRTKEELAGGALYDLGVYCVNAARNLFEAEPTSVFATLLEKDGVDDTTAVILRFPNGEIGQFTVSNSVSSVSSYRISGTLGDVRLEPAYDYSVGLTQYLTIDEKTTTVTFEKRDQFAPEISYFSRCILEDTVPEPSAEEAIDDLRVIEAAFHSARTGSVVELEPRDRRTRPSLGQEKKAPPVQKPETVKVSSPSVR